jgi:hypothetical protein
MAEVVDSRMPQWSEFVDLLKPAGELISDTFLPDSEQLRAQLYQQLVMNLSLGYFLYFQSDTDHPDWTPFLNSSPGRPPLRSSAAALSARRIGAQLRRRW